MFAASVSVDVGGVMVGIGGVLAASLSWWQAVKARRSAAEALAVSPAGALEALRGEVQAVLDAHQSSLARHQEERAGMEQALSVERMRADTAESNNLMLLGQLAGLRMDLAQARSEIAELKIRFEASLTTRP